MVGARLLYKLYLLGWGDSTEVLIRVHLRDVLGNLNAVTEASFVVVLDGDNHVFVIVERLVLRVRLRIGKSHAPANVSVQLIRADVKWAALLDGPFEVLVLMEI